MTSQPGRSQLHVAWCNLSPRRDGHGERETALTKLYVSWAAYREADNPAGYVRRTLVNALMDERKRVWRFGRPVAEVPERSTPATPADDGDPELSRALRALPPRMRAAVIFRFVHELDVAQTAEALGCSAGTVKSQTARALDKLRASLREPATPVVLEHQQRSRSMKELRTRIERLGGPVEPVSEQAIAADIARGHRAVRRRRTVQATAGSAFGVAAIVAAISLAGTGTSTHPGANSDAASASAASSSAPGGGVKLVAYRGTQSRWFTIDTVPEGFFIRHDFYGGLTIAPEAARHRPPGVNPSSPAGEIYDPQVLTGKIGIYLELKEYRGELSGDTLTVAGKQAILHPLDGGGQQLVIAVAPQVYATIQVDVPLSREQVLAIGAGLHVHQDAVDRMAAAAGVVPEKIKK